MTYDSTNIFAKILRGEIPNNTVFEDDFVLAFHDISPQAPIHIIVIPKGAYTDIHDFGAKATTDEITGFYRAVSSIVEAQNLDKKGFRCIANTKEHGGQEVPHFHMHIVGGEKLGPMMTLK